MTLARIQDTGWNGALASSASASFTSLPQPGNSILVAAWGKGATPSTIAFSDNQANFGYMQAVLANDGNVIGGNQWAAIGFCIGAIHSAGTFTVNVAPGVGTHSISCAAVEYSGLLSLDKISFGTGATGNPDTGTCPATTAPRSVAFAVMGDNTFASLGIDLDLSLPLGAFASIGTHLAVTFGGAYADAILTSPGSARNVWDVTIGIDWAAVLATFKTIPDQHDPMPMMVV